MADIYERLVRDYRDMFGADADKSHFAPSRRVTSSPPSLAAPYGNVAMQETASSERRTTLDLSPAQIPAGRFFRDNESGIAVIETAAGALFLHAAIGKHVDVPAYGVWALDGQSAEPDQAPLLAFRDWFGAWRVLDSRVSALLNKIDDMVEGV